MSVRFVIDEIELRALDRATFDVVWSALGSMIRAPEAVSAVEPTRVATIADIERAAALDSIPVFNGDAWTLDIPAAAGEAPVPSPPRAAKPAVPLGPVQVACDPGCGLSFAQDRLMAHRRACAVVAQLAASVRVLPITDPAPLPEVEAVTPADFGARARVAAGRTWDQNHAAQLAVEAAAAGHREVARAGRAPSVPIAGLAAADRAEELAPKPKRTDRDANGWTPRQAEVIGLVRKYGGATAAGRATGQTPESLQMALSKVRLDGRMPADVQAILDGNFGGHNRGSRKAAS